MVNLRGSRWKMGILQLAGAPRWLWLCSLRAEHTEPHLCGPNAGPRANPASDWDYLLLESCALCPVLEFGSGSILTKQVSILSDQEEPGFNSDTVGPQKVVVSLHWIIPTLFLSDSVARLSPPTQKVLGWHKASGMLTNV